MSSPCCRRTQWTRDIALGGRLKGMVGWSPASPFGLRRGSPRLLRYDSSRLACRAVACERGVTDGARLRPLGYAAAAFACFATIVLGVACRAVAREASEGWWSQAGSNRRPLACHASALPAELWPLKNRAPQSACGQ